MVQEYFVDQLRAVEQLADKRRAALNSRADAEAYVRDVRARIQRCFGPWPARTPLNARVTGVLQRDAYSIEKVVFDSRPNFPVTGNLYIPKKRSFPLPGVVGTCGHAAAGKASKSYQTFAQALARMGYVVLIFDPISQAERVQVFSPKLEPTSGRSGVSEHTRFSGHLSLVGESFAAWVTWDAIRAVDYLLSRKEVDPRHVGVTGNSGGGTQATWLSGVEPRLTMAAPSCFVTTLRRNLENELLADGEQYPAHILAEGLDHSDFLAAMAPKPVLLLGREMDFFDVRGLEETHARLRRLYQLLGAEDRVGLYVGPGGHRFAQDNREAMYKWFNRFTKVASVDKEPEVILEEEKDLWCTPSGQVVLQYKPKTLSVLSAERSSALRASRGSVSGVALKSAVMETLKLPPRASAPDARVLRPLPGRRYPRRHFMTYLVQSEPGIEAAVYLLSKGEMFGRPPQGIANAVLYVAHQSSDEELREEPLLAELVRDTQRALIYACDVRGVGDSHPNTGLQGTGGPEWFYAAHAMMLDRPYIGQRTHDLLCVLDWLRAQGHTEIHLAAKGWGAVVASFAALLHDSVKQVTLKQSLTSFAEIAERDFSVWPASLFPFGALKRFDLPDCYRELEAKKLKQIEPLSGLRKPPKTRNG